MELTDYQPLAVGSTPGHVELSANASSGVIVMMLVSGENRWTLEFSRAVSSTVVSNRELFNVNMENQTTPL